MKTRFILTRELSEPQNKVQSFKEYVKKLKPIGNFKMHKPEDLDHYEVYIDFDEEMHVNKGDTVFFDGYCIVERKIICPLEGLIIYDLEIE